VLPKPVDRLIDRENGDVILQCDAKHDERDEYDDAHRRREDDDPSSPGSRLRHHTQM
jgi:hypothetical protein